MRPPVAKLTEDYSQAALLVAAGTPAVLIAPATVELGRALARTACPDRAELRVALMAGQASERDVLDAAFEMAGELWPGPSRGDRR